MIFTFFLKKKPNNLVCVEHNNRIKETNNLLFFLVKKPTTFKLRGVAYPKHGPSVPCLLEGCGVIGRSIYGPKM